MLVARGDLASRSWDTRRVRSDDPPQSGEGDEEPTAVRETLEDFAMKRTMTDLRLSEEETADRAAIQRLKQSLGPGTPKINDLDTLLRELRKQRVEQATDRGRKETLRSIDRPDTDDRPIRASAPPSQPAPRRQWLPLVLAMLAGGALVALGTAVGGLRSHGAASTSEIVRLRVQVEPKSARLLVDGREVAAGEELALPCSGPLTVTIEAPGFATEHHHLACGTQAVIMARLQASP